MSEQGRGGRLIAIASIMGEWGSANAPAYCASKGGVKQLVKSFGMACGPYGITCHAIGARVHRNEHDAPHGGAGSQGSSSSTARPWATSAPRGCRRGRLFLASDDRAS